MNIRTLLNYLKDYIVTASQGTAGAPSFSFKDDTDTGLYRHSSGGVCTVDEGDAITVANTTALTVYKQLQASSGSVGAPGYSFSSDSNTGLWTNGSGEVRIAIDGTDAFAFNATGVAGPTVPVSSNNSYYATTAAVKAHTDSLPGFNGLVSDGTNLLPGLAFASDTNTGFFRDTNDEINVSLGGTERYSFTASGLTSPTVTAANNSYLINGSSLVTYLSRINRQASLYLGTKTLSSTSPTKLTGWSTSTNAVPDPTQFNDITTAASTGQLGPTTIGNFDITVSGWVDIASGDDVTTVELRLDDVAFTAPVLVEISTSTANSAPFTLHTVATVTGIQTVSVWAHYSGGYNRVLTNLHFTMVRLTV